MPARQQHSLLRLHHTVASLRAPLRGHW
jgi:hypothetical protein